MISEKEISLTLGDHLSGMAGAFPIHWPNKDAPLPTARPYLVFDLVRVSRTDRTMDGSAPVSRGFVQITIVGDLDTWANDTEDQADLISARFSYPRRLTVTGGTISMTQPPEIGQGFRDGPNWRLPVKVSYLAH